jgi:hypothetical protein
MMAVLTVETQLFGGLAHRCKERLDTGEGLRSVADKAVIANIIHRNPDSAPGAVEQLAKALIGGLGLLVSEAGDKAIEDDLPERQRQAARLR